MYCAQSHAVFRFFKKPKKPRFFKMGLDSSDSNETKSLSHHFHPLTIVSFT